MGYLPFFNTLQPLKKTGVRSHPLRFQRIIEEKLKVTELPNTGACS